MATILTRFQSKILYHRASIPDKLRAYFRGRSQLWRSLRTCDREIAAVRSARWTARIQQLFLTLKRRGAMMTNDQREALIARWMEQALDEAEDVRAMHIFDDDQREIMIDVTVDRLEEAEETLSENRYDRVAGEVDTILQSAGLPLLKHDSLEFKRLCRRFILAQQDLLKTEIDRWQGKYNLHRPAGHATTGSLAASVPPPAGPLFSVVVDKFLAETPRAARSAKPLKVELLKFVELIGGDRPMAAITKAEVRLYKEHLMNDRHLSMLTTAKHLSAVGAVFTWAALQGYVSSDNPAKGLAPSKKIIRKTMNKRRPFTEDELLRVFGSQEFLKQKATNQARYWIPLLCLFNVCRREEAAQLAVADVQEEKGIPFLDLRDNADLKQTLKNEGSRRRVPLHPSLIQLGFLDFVESVRLAGHARLFHKLTKGNSGYGDPIGKWFGRLVTDQGIVDEAVVLHSLRHGGISKLIGSGCPQNLCEIIAGHSAANVQGQTYVHRETIPLSLLREGLERLRYDEVVKALARVTSSFVV